MSKAAKFAPMRVENQWESLAFFVGNKKVYAGPRKVRWPSGVVEDAEIVMKPKHASYSDMGHSYDVATSQAWLRINHHGATIELLAENAACEFEVRHE